MSIHEDIYRGGDEDHVLRETRLPPPPFKCVVGQNHSSPMSLI
jgi:hypothetical protein